MLHRIYVIRHAETVDYAQHFLGDIPTPTGNHADVEISKVGIEQARQTAKRLAEENMPIDVVYSSPSYQCLETLRPIVTFPDGRVKHYVRVESGLRDWQDIDDLYPLCTGQCALKLPTMFPALLHHFPYIDGKYHSMTKMPPTGWRTEPPRRLLLRAHFLLHHLIITLDKARKPQTVLLCTHAPLVLAIARVLTAKNMPVYSDFDPQYNAFFSDVRRRCRKIAALQFCEPDFHVGYSSITRFDRRKDTEWTWRLSIDGSQAHLSHANGTWRFRPSPWQNRHTPHPVLFVCTFVKHLPGSLTWFPMAVVTTARTMGRELKIAMQRQLRNNPYRLPAWIYLCLWMALILAIINRVISLDSANVRWAAKKERHDEYQARADWLDALGNLCSILVQFSLFMFPPLLA